MKIRSLAAMLSASAMVIVPSAAHAGTKATDSVAAPVKYGTRVTAKAVSKKKALELAPALVIGLSAAAVGTGVLFATGAIGGDDGRSPGAN